jgi:hypothetical protein
MKLIDYKSDRRGNDQMKIHATWSDHMKRPASVQVTWGHLEHPTTEPQLMMEGDVKNGMDVLFSLAEMAWGYGWRPRGLAGSLAAYLQQYKVPPG